MSFATQHVVKLILDLANRVSSEFLREEASVSKIERLGRFFSLFQSLDVIFDKLDSQNVFGNERCFDLLFKNLVPLYRAEPSMFDDLANILESFGGVFCQKAGEQVFEICVSKVLQIWLLIQDSLHGFHLVEGGVHERRKAYHHFIQ